MEADWEVEIGGDSPVIDAAWVGFVDLSKNPTRVTEIAESSAQPGLADALLRLNASHSPVWTAKCDVWRPEAFDPDELDALPDAAFAAACYVDLLPALAQVWELPEAGVAWCKSICAHLRNTPLRSSRVDLIVRRTWITPDVSGIGLTAYITACGSSEHAARKQLSAALSVLVDAIVPPASPGNAASKYNENHTGE